MYSINSMSSSKDSVTTPKGSTSEERLIGRVKWFNNINIICNMILNFFKFIFKYIK